MKTLLLALALLGPVQQLDDDVAAAVQRARRPALETPMELATRVGQPVVVVGGLVVVAVLDGTLGAGAVRVALVALAGTNLTVEILKRVTFRMRPDGTRKRNNASFPSSHAANACALAWVLGRRWKRAAPLLWLFALAVCYSRMYLNRHWLSDVTAGAAIGMLWAWLAWRWLPPRARLERPLASAPLPETVAGQPTARLP